MLVLAFDTATDVATSALVADGEVLGERASRPATLLEDVDALLRQGGARAPELEALAVGIGPGSFTGTRIGLAVARVRTRAGVDARVAVEVGVGVLDQPVVAGEGDLPAVGSPGGSRDRGAEVGPRRHPDRAVVGAVGLDQVQLAPTCVGDGTGRASPGAG